jgi:hypothetical protein
MFHIYSLQPPLLVSVSCFLVSSSVSLSSVVCRLSSVVCRLSSVVCRLSSVVCRLSSVVCRLSSVVCLCPCLCPCLCLPAVCRLPCIVWNDIYVLDVPPKYRKHDVVCKPPTLSSFLFALRYNQQPTNPLSFTISMIMPVYTPFSLSLPLSLSLTHTQCYALVDEHFLNSSVPPGSWTTKYRKAMIRNFDVSVHLSSHCFTRLHVSPSSSSNRFRRPSSPVLPHFNSDYKGLL